MPKIDYIPVGDYLLPTITKRDPHDIIPAEDTTQEQSKPKIRKLGFMPGPPIPDNFFEPLLEEDLQAWEGENSWGF